MLRSFFTGVNNVAPVWGKDFYDDTVIHYRLIFIQLAVHYHNSLCFSNNPSLKSNKS